jgi:hypothetical protein
LIGPAKVFAEKLVDNKSRGAPKIIISSILELKVKLIALQAPHLLQVDGVVAKPLFPDTNWWQPC